MTNEQILQESLNNTIQRMGKKTIEYEAEIVNLNAEILILNSRINELNEKTKEKPIKTKPIDNS